jgi:glutathione S-transferase
MTPYTLIIGNKNYSSWSLRPWLAMQQFRVDFAEIYVPLYTPEAPQQLRRYSPAGKVPILQHGSRTIWDSLAILEYLAEQFPQQDWWPRDAATRSLARSLSAEMHSGFTTLRTVMPMNCRARFAGTAMTPALEQDIHRILEIWTTCRSEFSLSGDFLCGAFSIVDAMFAPVVLRFRTYGVALDAVCQTYAASMLALPAMQAWLQATEVELEVLPQYERESFRP